MKSWRGGGGLRPRLDWKVRLGGTGDANVDGTKVHIGMKTGVSGQILCEVVTSPLPDCITGMETMADWGLPPLLNIVKQRPVSPPSGHF